MDSFDWLIDCDPGGDLLFVITRGTADVRDVAPDGALTTALRHLPTLELPPRARVTLSPEVAGRRSVTLRSSVFGASDSALPSAWTHGAYWRDPSAHVSQVAPLFSSPAGDLPAANAPGPRCAA
jgi:hypothetical protein